MTAYEISPNRADELARIFTFHPVQLDQSGRYEHIRAAAHEVAIDIVTMTPPSREQSLAITHLQQAVMWANAAIAINESGS